MIKCKIMIKDATNARKWSRWATICAAAFAFLAMSVLASDWKLKVQCVERTTITDNTDGPNESTTGQDMVAEFKAYFSQPPRISRMIYAMEKTAEKNRQERFVLAYSPEAFYLRRIDHADNIDE